MNQQYAILLDKKIIDRNDNPLLIQAFKHLMKVQIFSTFFHLVLLVLAIVFLYYFYESLVKNNPELLRMFISSTVFMWFANFFISPSLHFIVFMRRSFIWEHPILKTKMAWYSVLGMLTLGIGNIIFFMLAKKILIKRGDDPYSYVNCYDEYYKKEKKYVNWILLILLLIISIGRECSEFWRNSF